MSLVVPRAVTFHVAGFATRPVGHHASTEELLQGLTVSLWIASPHGVAAAGALQHDASADRLGTGFEQVQCMLEADLTASAASLAYEYHKHALLPTHCWKVSPMIGATGREVQPRPITISQCHCRIKGPDHRRRRSGHWTPLYTESAASRSVFSRATS